MCEGWMRLQRPLIQKRRFPVLLRTSGDPRQGPAGRRGWLYARNRSARPRRAGNTRGTRSARRPGGRAPRATSSGGSPSLARVARAEVNTATSSGRVFASPRPSPQDRWTCSPPLGARSMSRFPAVAGRAPRRQEEGERSRDLQEERPSAGSVADRGAVRGTPRRPEGVVARGFGGGVGVEGMKVLLRQAEKRRLQAAAFLSPSTPEANFASREPLWTGEGRSQT